MQTSLTPPHERELLAMRVSAPAIIDTLQVYLTRDPQPSALLFSLALAGPTSGSTAVLSSASRGAASGTPRSHA